jgi:hypothetical protein
MSFSGKGGSQGDGDPGVNYHEPTFWDRMPRPRIPKWNRGPSKLELEEENKDLQQQLERLRLQLQNERFYTQQLVAENDRCRKELLEVKASLVKKDESMSAGGKKRRSKKQKNTKKFIKRRPTKRRIHTKRRR